MEYKNYGFSNSLMETREKLLGQGINPYPYSFEHRHNVKDILQDIQKSDDINLLIGEVYFTAGRVWAKRTMGKSVFADLKDSTGKIQCYFNAKNLTENEWFIILNIDLGDIIGIAGIVFRTKTGENTLRVKKIELLSKVVVPIPIGKETDEKVYYRASDPELKYRERYLHWMLNENDRNRILLRNKIISLIRSKMEQEGFLEVSTPTIEFVYGGAEARPFRTNIWALSNKDAFLRISPELYLKRYIVAGFEKVFTICQNFRNEGIDLSHNPEFTMMEWYESYTDYEFQMNRFENLVASVCNEINGSLKIIYQGIELDFTPPWKRISVVQALKEYSNLDVTGMTIDSLKTELNKREIEYNREITFGLAISMLFEHDCEEHLIQPTFVIDHAIEISPLTKVKRGDKRFVERFEPFVCGIEIGNAYSELTDPIDQLERLLNQRQNQSEDFENHPVDSDFVKAIGCGMPPTGGVGLGIDRLIMLLTDSQNIRDIIPFPMIKPKY